MAGKFNLSEVLARQSSVVPAQTRTIETVTAEILAAKKAGGEAILAIGRGLIEAKEMLPHGEGRIWLEEQVEFSERTAQRFMRLAREWSNPTALSDLGATKALALLALPAEEREQFMAEANVVDMTSHQLEQAIKERDEARKAAEMAQSEARAAEASRDQMEKDMAVANAALAGAREDAEQAGNRVIELESELSEMKTKPVDVAVETVVDQAAVDKARAEAISEMQAKVDKAKETAEKAKFRQQEAEAKLSEIQEQLLRHEREEKRAELSADKDLARFEILFGQVQETVNKMHGILLKVKTRDEDAGGRLAKALQALAEAVRRCADEQLV